MIYECAEPECTIGFCDFNFFIEMKFNMTHVLLVFREILLLVSKKAFFKKILRVSILCGPGVSLSVKGVSILMLKAVLTWQRVSLSTTCSMNVQGVSHSATNSIIVKGVSIPVPKTVLTWQRVSLSTSCSMNVQGVSLSAPNSIIVNSNANSFDLAACIPFNNQYERAGCIPFRP